jgi:hypothetical protein
LLPDISAVAAFAERDSLKTAEANAPPLACTMSVSGTIYFSVGRVETPYKGYTVCRYIYRTED